MKLIIVTLFCLQIMACSVAPARMSASEERLPNSLQGLTQFCSNLLTTKENKFSFEKFCSVREKFLGKTITEKDFDGWREMAVEELMALIELHTQQTQELTKGLELENLNEKKMKRLNKAVLKLQKSEKNTFKRVRALVSEWYEITHSENLKLTIKKNPLTIEKFFAKVRMQNRLERLESELASRSAVEVFKEAGLAENATWWEKTKNWVKKPVQPPVDMSVHATLEALPSLLVNRYTVQTALWTFLTVPVVMTGNYMIFLPYYDLDTAAKLADEVQQEMATGKGIEAAKQIVLARNTKRNVISSYLQATSKYVNTAMFAALLVWAPYSHYLDVKADNAAKAEKIMKVMNTPKPAQTKDEKSAAIVDEITDSLVQSIEQRRGTKVSESERALLRKSVSDAQRTAEEQIAKTQ